ncbi:MAG: T9SS type A sorting domain-containing protein [Chitinophagaceae bacterium]|nr:T9SS type A sorting domain-containing protein [Chitinophagaceae bacterium]
MKKMLLRLPFKPLLTAAFTVAYTLLLHLHGSTQQWIAQGNESQISAVASSATTITVLGNVPYVAYIENSSPSVGKVKRKNSITGAWEQVGTDVASNISYLRIYNDGGTTLYVTYVDGGNGSRLAVKKYNSETQTWDPLISGDPYVSSGSVTYSISQFSSTPRAAMAFDRNQVPYISFAERSTGYPFVKRFTDGAWETVGGGSVTTDFSVGNGVAIDYDNVPYVIYLAQSGLTSTTGAVRVFRLDANNAWENVSPASPVAPGSSSTGSTTGARHSSITMDSLYNPIVAYFNTSNSNRSTIIRYNVATSTWQYIGTTGTRDAPFNSLIRDNAGNVYNAFTDLLVNGGTAPSGRVFKLAYGASAFTEVKDADATRGVDAASVSNINVAVGSDTSKPFVVYTKNNSNSVITPVVLMYSNTIVTKAVTNIGTSTATVAGEVVYDGGTAITERGIVYGSNPNPTTANNKLADATTGTGAYSIALTGLTDYTMYYVRAYATNANGTSYGANVAFSTLSLPDAVVSTPKQMEKLNRGVVAVRTSPTNVYVGWRLLGTEPSTIAFNVYRDGEKLNTTPISNSTNYEDNVVINGTYVIKPVINGEEGDGSAAVSVWNNNQLTIPLQIPPGGTTPNGIAYTYSANDCSVGDVDGDGEYEIILKWDPSAKNDNAGGYTGNTIIDCYKLNGTKLWRIDLGKNISAGPHFTQIMVYDLDGDGKAELACKTADGSIDGTGNVIGDANADYRNSSGWVLTGPEYLTVFNGLTGAAMATVPYEPARGNVSDWGDSYGNRCERYVSAIAYLDGARPSLIIGRGYYAKLARAAYDWRNGQLTLRWLFTSTTPGNGAYAGMGHHQMTIGDADGDGKDEIFNGSSAINDNGRRFWSNGLGHGDALHMTDMDPDRAGMEIWMCLESPSNYGTNGLVQIDAATGNSIWGVPTTGDVGRAMAADIDPAHKGYEMWGSSGNLYNAKGQQISTSKPTYNFGIWWDGDLSRELLDGTKIDKWNPATNSLNRLFTIYNAAPISSNNSTKANPCLSADLLGDWREEILFRYADNSALVLFTSTIPTAHRIQTLMHDPQYRTAIAWQNSAYNQPPYPGFYLGNDMPAPPVPNIYLADGSSLPVKLQELKATQKNQDILLEWRTSMEQDMQHYVVEKSTDGRHFQQAALVPAKAAVLSNQYHWLDIQPGKGIHYYRIVMVEKDGSKQYSKIVRVSIQQQEQRSAVLYPSPLSGNTCSIQLNELPKGEYNVRISNTSGHHIWQQQIIHPGGSAAQTVQLPAAMSNGIYQLTIEGKDWRQTSRFIKQ